MFSTDLVGRIKEDITCNVEAGFSPAQALKHWTGNAGIVLKWSGPKDPYPTYELGTIKEGAYADLLLWDGNPLNKQPLAWAFQGLGGQGRGWGADFKRRLRDFPRTVPLVAILEDLPMEANRIDLDPDVVDDRGLPAPRITHRQHPNDVAMNRWFTARMLEMADAAGARQKWEPVTPFALVDENSPMPGSVHLHGTSRMGDDPTMSVVDRWCRSHDVPNLWVVDCGVFPTSGGYNPTLTLLAMAYRAADRMIAEAKRQNA